MKYLFTKNDHYIKYVEEHGSDRLCKNLKLYITSKDILLKKVSNNINEIFDKNIKTDYDIVYNNNNILISFLSNSEFKYRLDIFKIKEINGVVNHISFSKYDGNINDEENYEELLNKNEMIEVINRIHYILKDLVKNNNITNYFCIGGCDLLSKNRIYEYALKTIVGVDGFKKLYTDLYDSKFGLYFKI